MNEETFLVQIPLEYYEILKAIDADRTAIILKDESSTCNIKLINQANIYS